MCPPPFLRAEVQMRKIGMPKVICVSLTIQRLYTATTVHLESKVRLNDDYNLEVGKFLRDVSP